VDISLGKYPQYFYIGTYMFVEFVTCCWSIVYTEYSLQNISQFILFILFLFLFSNQLTCVTTSNPD